MIRDLDTSGETLFPSIESHKDLLEDSSIDHAEPSVRVKFMNFFNQLLQEAELRMKSLESENSANQSQESTPKIDEPIVSSSTNDPVAMELDDFSKNDIFTELVVLEDSHPSSHKYAGKTEFSPEHHFNFLSTVRSELKNLRDQVAPGLKVRTYCDRYVSLSTHSSFHNS